MPGAAAARSSPRRSLTCIRFRRWCRRSRNLPSLLLAQMCVRPEVVEGLWLPESLRPSLRGSLPAELDEARLLRMQLQGELPESLPQALQELLGIRAVLEPNDEVIGPASDDHVSSRVPLPPLLDPQVEDVMEVDVRQQWQTRSPPVGSPPPLPPTFPSSITPALSHFQMSGPACPRCDARRTSPAIRD